MVVRGLGCANLHAGVRSVAATQLKLQSQLEVGVGLIRVTANRLNATATPYSDRPAKRASSIGANSQIGVAVRPVSTNV